MRAGLLGCAAATVVAGCSATQTGHGFGPVYDTVPGLAAKLAKGTDELTTVRGTLHVKSGPLDQTSTFSETLSRGNVTAMDDNISTTFQGKTSTLHMIIVGSKIYVDRGGGSDKPWVIATPDSSDPLVAQLAQNVSGTLGQTGLHQYVVLVSSAKQLDVIGPEDVNGTPTVHYHLAIDTRTAAAKLPGAQGQQMQAAVNAGVDSIPMDLWVDSGGRSVKVDDQVSAKGTTATVELVMKDFDQNFSIHPPPAAKISDG